MGHEEFRVRFGEFEMGFGSNIINNIKGKITWAI